MININAQDVLRIKDAQEMVKWVRHKRNLVAELEASIIYYSKKPHKSKNARYKNVCIYIQQLTYTK